MSDHQSTELGASSEPEVPARTPDNDTALLLRTHEWLVDNPKWLLGVSPLLVTAVQFLAASGGDRVMLTALLKNLQPMTVIFGSVLPSIPFIALITCGYFIERIINNKYVPNWTPAAISWPIVLGIWIMPASSYLFTIAVLTVGLTIIGIAKWKKRRPLSRSFFTPVSFVSSLIVFAAVSGPDWLATEFVKTSTGESFVAYAVNATDGWSTFIKENGVVEILPIKNIVSRQACGVSTPNMSIGRSWSGRFGANLRCRDLQNRTDNKPDVSEPVPTRPPQLSISSSSTPARPPSSPSATTTPARPSGSPSAASTTSSAGPGSSTPSTSTTAASVP